MIRHLLYIFSKSGAGISTLSSEPDEDEVLFQAGHEFRVLLKHFDEATQQYKLILDDMSEENAGSTGLADALVDGTPPR